MADMTTTKKGISTPYPILYKAAIAVLIVPAWTCLFLLGLLGGFASFVRRLGK
jgi:hypothetical protein